MIKIIHLHTRSSYTLLNSTLKISDIIFLNKKNNFNAACLVDKNVMYGALNFYNECIANNLKPIIGLEIDVEYNQSFVNLILLAKNNQGYEDLVKLSSNICVNNKNISLEMLSSYTNDCVVITTNYYDILYSYLLKDTIQDYIDLVSLIKNYCIDFYLGISMNDSGLFKIKNEIMDKLSTTLDIEQVALSLIYYANKEDENVYKTIRAIDEGLLVNDKSLVYSSNRYFRSIREMQELYSKKQLDNTKIISDKCNIKLPSTVAKLPKFKNNLDIESSEFLTRLCKKGLHKRFNYKEIPNNYIERLDYELSIIINMKFEDYFLIVYDFIRFAKTKDIYVGPGRGSAAGSLVSYCLGITHVDPIKYNLLFERFLNPQRISMPDIDTDFPDNKRDLVIKYVKETYGEECVAQIITFNTLGAKQAIRDVGRALNIALREIDMICKSIPNLIGVNLEYAYKNSNLFREFIDGNSRYKMLFKIAKKIEGLPRHTSIHAAGIVMSDKDLSDYLPIIKNDNINITTQFTMEYMEPLGLIKMDFLGLRNLTIIDEIVDLIKNKYDKNFNIMKIDIEDKKTMQLIRNIDVVGIFQLESEGMKNLLNKMNPTKFEDIVATIALFRPGPMENIPEYLKRRNDPKLIEYPHPDLEDILKDTYGIMIYQEQIMQVAQKMAGFTLAKSDLMRKAISKKKNDSLEGLKLDFIQGALENGYSKNDAINVYELIMKFANYGFNKSHSVAYGLIAYQMAYLKANYSIEFHACLLNNSERKTVEYIFECKKHSIQVLGPCINRSYQSYCVEDKTIRCPLNIINGLGNNTANDIINEREKNGSYNNYFEFIARMNVINVNRKNMELLIYSGALDIFKINRTTMIANIETVLRYSDLIKIEEDNQIRLDFNIVANPKLEICNDNKYQLMDMERNCLGFYLKEHPLTQIRTKYSNAKSLIDLKNKFGYFEFIAQITRIKQHRTKHGELMCFVDFSDDTSDYNGVIMPNLFKENQEIIQRGNYVYVKGKVDKHDSILINNISLIDINNQLT